MLRDAFQKRERASEDFAIRQREQEKIKELRKKLAEQHAHLKTLEESMLVLPQLKTRS
jgi:ATPase inhibitor, mitochondrial